MYDKVKKKECIFEHPQLGEIRYMGKVGKPAFKGHLRLWNKDYDVPLDFVVENQESGITPVQVEAYEKFKCIVMEQREEIERLAFPKEKSTLKLSDRIIPQYVYFSSKGECAIFFDDMEAETGNSVYYSTFCTKFAITVLPVMLKAPYRICVECMLGRKDFASIKELAGIKD